MQDLATVESVSARLETVLARLSARFRGMPESKLHGRLPDGRSRAAAGYELAGRIALAAQGVEDRGLGTPPAWRALPFDGALVVGDQIGVTGRDLLVASASLLGLMVGDEVGEAATEAEVDIEGDGGSGSQVWALGDEGCARVEAGELLGRVLGEAEELARVI